MTTDGILFSAKAAGSYTLMFLSTFYSALPLGNEMLEVKICQNKKYFIQTHGKSIDINIFC